MFEDLQWIDSETQALLDGLVESLGSARLLLLVELSPRVPARVGQQDVLHPAPARRAPAESAGELLMRSSGDDPGLAPLKQLLVEREGNPFFLEESIRTLVETGASTGSGRVSSAPAVQAIEVPAPCR